jgi:hypothetical protein
MFGQAPPAIGKIADWLQYLKAVDSSSRAGELMHKSLLEDGNVCNGYGEQARQFIESQPATVHPQGAQGTYHGLLSHLKANGCRYCDPYNDGNRLSAAAFGRFARVVSAEAFAQHNLTPQVKTNRRSLRRAVGAELTANRISAIGGDTRRLVGQIGSDPSFAARSESVQPQADGSFDADEIRNRLGLDDARNFPRRTWLVVMRYREAQVPDGTCYRPTVLDAGWYPAFRPSPPGPPAPGWTQHLQTGGRGCEEVIHAPLDANQLDAFDLIGPLGTDPPDAYKAVRLATTP